MDRLTSLLSTCSLQANNSYQKRPSAPFRYIAFKMFSAGRNIVSEYNILINRPCFHIFSLHFQIVSNTTRTHHLQLLFSFYSLHFKIFLNTVTMHALKLLFSSISLPFQNTIRVHVQEKLFSFFLCSFKFARTYILYSGGSRNF